MKKLTVAALCSLTSLCTQAQDPSNRYREPIVLTGAQLSQYAGTPVDRMAAFRYRSGSWEQIPLQVDERALIDIVKPYGPLAATAGFPPSPSNPKILAYCDPDTYVGADSDPLFDADDEIVFMAKEAGDHYTGGSQPVGTVPGSCTEITIVDPVPVGGTNRVYLFRHDGSLDASAGQSYLTYTSNVSSVSGWPAHANGPNPENTEILTEHYSWHISGEWLSTGLKILLATGADILDRHKNFFADGTCVRSEDTFSDAENAYLTEKAGPVRVIRSVMGANSGPLTQRTHLFYQGRIDILTDLRVHSIPSVYDAFDYSPSASGMTYTNSLNPNGVIVDGTGNTDGLNLNGEPEWEQLSGQPGTLCILHRKTSNLNSQPTDGTTFRAYYNDNSTAPASNCTGDGQAWGTGGWGAVFAGTPNPTTDPLENVPHQRYLSTKRILYVGASGVPSMTQTLNHQYNNPLQISATACIQNGLGLADAAQSQASLYPNPASHEVTLSLSIDRPEHMRYTLTDMTGRSVQAGPLTQNRQTFSVETLPVGIYLLHILQDGREIKTIKLVRN